MLDFAALFPRGKDYHTFLADHGSDTDRGKWAAARTQVALTEEQRFLLSRFKREMPVVVLAGAWCGDCVSQCPLLQEIADASDKITLRFFDRDAFPELGEELQVCGAARVPAVQFLAEDFAPTGRYGDRTLVRYRQMAEQADGDSCSTGLGQSDATRAAVAAEWVGQFERNQLILRTSGRLRKKHGD